MKIENLQPGKLFKDPDIWQLYNLVIAQVHLQDVGHLPNVHRHLLEAYLVPLHVRDLEVVTLRDECETLREAPPSDGQNVNLIMLFAVGDLDKILLLEDNLVRGRLGIPTPTISATSSPIEGV
jgi:hypothetical protein